jgi:hypothetical protein
VRRGGIESLNHRVIGSSGHRGIERGGVVLIFLSTDCTDFWRITSWWWEGAVPWRAGGAVGMVINHRVTEGAEMHRDF